MVAATACCSSRASCSLARAVRRRSIGACSPAHQRLITLTALGFYLSAQTFTQTSVAAAQAPAALHSTIPAVNADQERRAEASLVVLAAFAASQAQAGVPANLCLNSVCTSHSHHATAVLCCTQPTATTNAALDCKPTSGTPSSCSLQTCCSNLCYVLLRRLSPCDLWLPVKLVQGQCLGCRQRGLNNFCCTLCLQQRI